MIFAPVFSFDNRRLPSSPSDACSVPVAQLLSTPKSPRTRFISTISGDVVEEADSVVVTMEAKTMVDMCMKAGAVVETRRQCGCWISIRNPFGRVSPIFLLHCLIPMGHNRSSISPLQPQRKAHGISVIPLCFTEGEARKGSIAQNLLQAGKISIQKKCGVSRIGKTVDVAVLSKMMSMRK